MAMGHGSIKMTHTYTHTTIYNLFIFFVKTIHFPGCMCNAKITNMWYSVSISRTHVFIHSRRQMRSVLSLARILHGWLSLAGIPFPRRRPENLGATGAIQIWDWHLRRQPETHINTTDWKVYGTSSSQHISGGGSINNTNSQEYCQRSL